MTDPYRSRAEIPWKLRFLFDPPLGAVRYRVAFGGRGSAKSWSFARALLVLGANTPLRIGCFREYQASIRDSVHQLLADQAEMIGLGSFYGVKQTAITGRNGTEFLFQGIKRDPHKLKSLERINIAWVEEAEAVSNESWSVLIPTIRADNSEIWVSFNPAQSDDPTWQRFVEDPPARAIVEKIGYRDNPWLPSVLLEEAEELKRRDPEAYAYIWGGEPWKRSDAEVLAGKWRVDEFTPADHWEGPYYGADWGFARDPSVLDRMWIADSRLFIEYDERGVGWDMDQLARHFARVPGAQDHTIRGDSARPETINELNRRGFRVKAAPKWKGSVEDGVEFLRSFDEIIIHPRCKEWIQEARMWRYQVDKRTGDVMPKLVDAHNHGPDAVRYAMAPLIKTPRKVRVWFPGMDSAKDDAQEAVA